LGLTGNGGIQGKAVAVGGNGFGCGVGPEAFLRAVPSDSHCIGQRAAVYLRTAEWAVLSLCASSLTPTQDHSVPA
jgi:hypothetical protein